MILGLLLGAARPGFGVAFLKFITMAIGLTGEMHTE